MAALAGVRARTDSTEAVLIAMAVVHGALLMVFPSIPLIATAMWWNANTISNNFRHRPFFHSTWANRAFSCHLTLVLGFPQSLWRARHLEHHGLGGDCRRQGLAAVSPVEIGLLLALWGAMAFLAPHFVLVTYLPG